MSNTPAQPTPPVSPLMRALLNNRKYLRGAIFVVAAAFIAFPLVQLIRQGGLGGGIRLGWVYAAVMGLVSLAIGAIDLVGDETDEGAQVAKLRLELMVLGGLLGLGTAALGFVLPFTAYREELGGGLESWRANPTALVWPGLAVVGGLGLMFASVQLVRGMERQSQAVRRVVYGYNVVLTTLLLVAVLALPNVLAYAEPFTRFFGRPFDWTATDINSISPLMRNFLADMKEPVKVYVLLPRNSPITQDTLTLLEHCRSLSTRLSWEPLDPRLMENRERILKLTERYSISDPSGLLVVVGTEDEQSKPDFAFIKFEDLFEQDRGMPGQRPSAVSYSFFGENALYNALSSLTEGKMVVYFTTDHGELSPDAGRPAMPGMPPPQDKAGLSKLRDRLTERKSVEVKSLALRKAKAVPDDASVVVIARPTQAFSEDEVKVLRDYLQRQARTEEVKEADGRKRQVEKVTAGKLVLLVDPVTRKQDGGVAMTRLGLESLLAEYQVELGNNRILSVQMRMPQAVVVMADGRSANPVAKAFSPNPIQEREFVLLNARTVEPAAGKGGGKNVDKLLITVPDYLPIADTNLDADPAALVSALRRDRDRLRKLFKDEPLTVAVAVSDAGAPAGMPRDRAHGGLLTDTPRMVVFGSSSWVSDEMLQGGRGTMSADLFISCLSWLRGKSSVGQTIDAKKRKEYVLGVSAADSGKLLYLPLGLLLLGVVGLGTGVWVVRRR